MIHIGVVWRCGLICNPCSSPMSCAWWWQRLCDDAQDLKRLRRVRLWLQSRSAQLCQVSVATKSARMDQPCSETPHNQRNELKERQILQDLPVSHTVRKITTRSIKHISMYRKKKKKPLHFSWPSGIGSRKRMKRPIPTVSTVGTCLPKPSDDALKDCNLFYEVELAHILITSYNILILYNNIQTV